LRVSAIISTYNSARLISGCLEDLLNQTLYQKGELEIVVIDSGSSENEGEIVLELQKGKPRIEYLRTEARESIYQAWNRGIRMAKGQYLTNANTDDRHDCDSLEKLASKLDGDDEAVIAYGDSRMTGPCEEQFQKSDFPNREFFAPSLLLYNLFGYQPMWKASLHSTIGYFNEDLKKAGDYDFGLRAAKAGKAIYVKEAFGTVYWGGETQTLADSTMIREINLIKEHWLGEKQVLGLYAKEGFAVEKPEEQARAYRDLANRFLCFFPQWKGGQAESEPDQSIAFYKRSMEKHPCIETANNLAVAIFAMGEAEEAVSYLSQFKQATELDFAKENLIEMKGFLDGRVSYPTLNLTEPFPTVPKEYEVSPWENRIFPSRKASGYQPGYAWRKFSISALWEDWIGNLSSVRWTRLTSLREDSKVFIHGAGARGRIFLNHLLTKGVNVSGFIDQNAGQLDGLPLPIYTPFDLPTSGSGDFIVIVMTGRAHWNSIHSNLLEFFREEDIWFPDDHDSR